MVIESDLFHHPLTAKERLIATAPFLASPDKLLEKGKRIAAKRIIKEILDSTLPDIDPTLILTAMKLANNAQRFTTEEKVDNFRPSGLVEKAVRLAADRPYRKVMDETLGLLWGESQETMDKIQSLARRENIRSEVIRLTHNLTKEFMDELQTLEQDVSASENLDVQLIELLRDSFAPARPRGRDDVDWSLGSA
jgi:hypothetical protein